jgi:hypothetical protein
MVTNNSGSFDYIFTGNGNFTFTFEDESGATGEAIAVVNWIDKTPVTGTISYSTTGLTNQAVIAMISFNKSGVNVMNNVH